MLSLDMCSLLEGNITITMPLKKKYRQLEQWVQRIKERLSAGQVSIWCTP